MNRIETALFVYIPFLISKGREGFIPGLLFSRKLFVWHPVCILYAYEYSLEERHRRHFLGGQYWDTSSGYCIEDPSAGLTVAPWTKAESVNVQTNGIKVGEGGK